MSDTEERTYAALLGQLGEKPTIWVECLFVDPIADIAVLGSPDDQALPEASIEYHKFTNSLEPLEIADVPQETPARMLSLDGRWISCTVKHIDDGRLYIRDATEAIRGGMSGSPIMTLEGSAVGVICVAGGAERENYIAGGPNPRLVQQFTRLAFAASSSHGITECAHRNWRLELAKATAALSMLRWGPVRSSLLTAGAMPRRRSSTNASINKTPFWAVFGG
jgi:hypothetical protein